MSITVGELGNYIPLEPAPGMEGATPMSVCYECGWLPSCPSRAYPQLVDDIVASTSATVEFVRRRYCPQFLESRVAISEICFRATATGLPNTKGSAGTVLRFTGAASGGALVLGGAAPSHFHITGVAEGSSTLAGAGGAGFSISASAGGEYGNVGSFSVSATATGSVRASGEALATFSIELIEH